MINNFPVEVPEGSTVLQACQQVGIEIPVFCYHPKLPIAGNCRMCLVEMEKSLKPIASCAMPASEGMVIHTNTDKVKKARQGVLELLLINHPLDCPICDQGGECDLQDITMSYGRGRNRFDLNKRSVEDKYMGPLIKTVMTRCIHCTRCIRFCQEVAGTSELGTLHRGEETEITTLLESAITSELSGNLIDICPVGALTNKPHAFHGRSWELTKTPSIDVMDAVGSRIWIDTRVDTEIGSPLEVMRILPRSFDPINEEWISDKTRFSYDGLTYQRLDQPYLRHPSSKDPTKKNPLQPVSWTNALDAAAKLLTSVKSHEVATISGDMCDVEALYSLKKLMEALEVPHLESRWNGSRLMPQCREDYLFNVTIEGIEKADVCLIIGANPRTEATLVNARLKKRMRSGALTVGLVGKAIDLTYSYTHLGDTPGALAFLRDPTHPFTRKIALANHPMIILGEAVFAHPDAEKLEHFIKVFCLENCIIREGWNGYNVLATAAATVGAFDVGFLPKSNGFVLEDIYGACERGEIKVVYLLGADQIDFARLRNALIIYQGHHGDEGANHADIILPGVAYTEKNATYVNLEGRIQKTQQAVLPPNNAKEDWRILRALSEVCGSPLAFNTPQELYRCLVDDYPLFATDGMRRDTYVPKIDKRKASAALSHRPFLSPVSDFYMSNIIAKNSIIMAECALAFKKALKERVKAHD